MKQIKYKDLLIEPQGGGYWAITRNDELLYAWITKFEVRAIIKIYLEKSENKSVQA